MAVNKQPIYWKGIASTGRQADNSENRTVEIAWHSLEP